jgi:hypothetical protein
MVAPVSDSEREFTERVERRIRAAIAQLLDCRGDDTSAEELLAVTFEVADGIAEGILDQLDANEQPVCKEQCVHCCYAPLEVSWVEAVTLAEHLLECVEPEGQTVLMEALEQHAGAARGLGNAARHAHGLPCPLLVETSGRCSVYPLRPLRCRGAHSLDLVQCERSLTDPDAEIEVNAYLYTTYVAASRELGRSCEQLGVPSEQGELSVFLNQALRALTSRDHEAVNT